MAVSIRLLARVSMMDNFTNIKTNFQYAEDEIDDLQSKGVFKAALTGTTLDNNMANNVIYNAQVRGMSGTVVAIAATSGTVNIDCNAGPYQTISITGNIILAFTAATWPSAGTFWYDTIASHCRCCWSHHDLAC
jgi:hypothetical protein